MCYSLPQKKPLTTLLTDPIYATLAKELLAAAQLLREALPAQVHIEERGALLHLRYNGSSCCLGWYKPGVFSIFRCEKANSGEDWQPRDVQILTVGGLVSATRVYLKL